MQDPGPQQVGSIVNISETPAQLRPHRQDRWANREPQAAPSTRRRFGTCPLAAAGPPTQLSAGGLPLACPPQLREAPAGSGSWRKALGQQSNARSPTPARPHALTVGPAPGTVSAGATTTDLDRHRPCTLSHRLEVAHGKGGLTENVVMNLRAHSRGLSPRSSLQLKVCESCFHAQVRPGR